MSFVDNLPQAPETTAEGLDLAGVRALQQVLEIPSAIDEELDRYSEARSSLQALYDELRPGWIARRRGALLELPAETVQALTSAESALKKKRLDAEDIRANAQRLVAAFEQSSVEWDRTVASFESGRHKRVLKSIPVGVYGSAYSELTVLSPHGRDETMNRAFADMRAEEKRLCADRLLRYQDPWEATLLKYLSQTIEGQEYLTALRLSLGGFHRATVAVSVSLHNTLSTIRNRVRELEGALQALTSASDAVRTETREEISTVFDSLLTPIKNQLAAVCGEEPVKVSNEVSTAIQGECVEEIRTLNRAVVVGGEEIEEVIVEARGEYAQLCDSAERLVRLRAICASVEKLLERELDDPNANSDLLRALAGHLHAAQVARDDREALTAGARLVFAETVADVASRIAPTEEA